MSPYRDLEECVGFAWDDGNEAEEIFFNDPLVAGADVRHSKRERRYFALGRTSAGRYLFVAFTIRANLIRVISARDMTRREIRKYES